MLKKMLRTAGLAFATAVAVVVLLPTSAHAASYWQQMPVYERGTTCFEPEEYNDVLFQLCFGYSARDTHVQGVVSVYNKSPHTRHFVQARTGLYEELASQPVPGTFKQCPHLAA